MSACECISACCLVRSGVCVRKPWQNGCNMLVKHHAILVHAMLRGTNFKFLLQPHQRYHITQYEERLFITYSDGRRLHYQFSLPHLYISLVLFVRQSSCRWVLVPETCNIQSRWPQFELHRHADSSIVLHCLKLPANHRVSGAAQQTATSTAASHTSLPSQSSLALALQPRAPQTAPHTAPSAVSQDALHGAAWDPRPRCGRSADSRANRSHNAHRCVRVTVSPPARHLVAGGPR